MLGNTILLLLLVVGLGLKSISSSTFVEALEICLDSKCDVKIGMQFCMNTQMAKMNTHTLLINIKRNSCLFYYWSCLSTLKKKFSKDTFYVTALLSNVCHYGSAWMNVYQKNDKVTNRPLWPWIEQASRINLQWKHCLIWRNFHGHRKKTVSNSFFLVLCMLYFVNVHIWCFLWAA